MLLHHKLENALQSWIQENKGAMLEGVHIICSHATAEPPYPYLGIWCGRAQPHPDFPGQGRGFPQIVPIVLQFSLCPEDALVAREQDEEAIPYDAETGAVHAETIAKWAAELDELLAGESGDYQVVRDALNIPETGPDTRQVKNLYITAIHPGDFSSEMDGIQWDEAIALEIVAQNRDPV